MTKGSPTHINVGYQGLAPNNQSVQYTKKKRILIALVVGICLIGVCILVFYLSADARRTELEDFQDRKAAFTPDEGEIALSLWRSDPENECLATTQIDCPVEFGEPPLILLVLGGLRTDQVALIPAIKELIKCGVSAKSLVPSYPTYNYPNLYSIATGLYPESHGIVSYKMYDPQLQLNFTIGSPDSQKSEWWGGEPIWNTLTKQGKRSATYLWPGSDVRIQGTFPTYWQKEKIIFKGRIKKIVDWIEHSPEERPNIIMMYYEEPITVSQRSGIDSPKVKEELDEISEGIDELMAAVQSRNLSNCINFMVVSDHGVAPSECDKTVYVDEILKEPIPGRLTTGAVGTLTFNSHIKADPKEEERLVQILECKDRDLRVLRKPQVPKRYHYTRNSRIGDIVLDTRVGSRVATESDIQCLGGDHGYNNLEQSMEGVFIAQGPAFEVGKMVEPFRNVEIYDLLSHILKVQPAPNNGTRGSLLHLLKRNFVEKEDYFNEPKRQFLKEVIKPRVNRPFSGAVDGVALAEVMTPHCHCDQSYLEKMVSIQLEKVSAEIVLDTPGPTTTTSTTSEATTTTTTTTTSTTTTTTTEEPTTTTPEPTTITPEPTTITPEPTTTTPEPIITASSSTPTTTTTSEPIITASSLTPITTTTSEPITTSSTASTSTTTEPTSTASTTTTSEPIAVTTSTPETSPTINVIPDHDDLTITNITAVESPTNITSESTTATATTATSESTTATSTSTTSEATTTASSSTTTTSNPSVTSTTTPKFTTTPGSDVVTILESEMITTIQEIDNNTTVHDSTISSTSEPTITTASSPTTDSVSSHVISSQSTITSTTLKTTSTPTDSTTTATQASNIPSAETHTPHSTNAENSTITIENTSIFSTNSSLDDDHHIQNTSTASPMKVVLAEPLTIIEGTGHIQNLEEAHEGQMHVEEPEQLPLPLAFAKRNRRSVFEQVKAPPKGSSSIPFTSEGVAEVSIVGLKNIHCPWDIPHYSAPEVASDVLNVLLHTSHIIGLPESLSLGVWTSFTTSQTIFEELHKLKPSIPEDVSVEADEIKHDEPSGCWVADPRLNRSSSDQCSRSYQTDLYQAKNVSLKQLFPEEFETPDLLQKEGFLLSNLAPVLSGYKKGGRKIMLNAIEKWTSIKGTLNVVHGPIFDYNFDGKKDDVTVLRNTVKPLVPSDYYFIVTSCNSTGPKTATTLGDCPINQLQIVSFVFPNTQFQDNCLMTDQEYLKYHMASLADVEALTGLRFFSKIEYKDYAGMLAQQPTIILSIEGKGEMF